MHHPKAMLMKILLIRWYCIVVSFNLFRTTFFGELFLNYYYVCERRNYLKKLCLGLLCVRERVNYLFAINEKYLENYECLGLLLM